MRARRRLFIISLCVLLFVAAVAVVVVLRKRAAPEAARLLPEADAVVYIDFATVRNLTQLDQQQLPRLAPEYEDFVKQTDFSFERDLDEAAMAVHRGTGGRATRYSEILIGRYDQGKIAAYLRQRAASMESYRNVEVFSIPIENRTLRIALLTIDTVAISNVDDPGVLHGIIDRFKKVALPFGGPRLVRTYYPKIPLGSLLWTVAHLPAGAQTPQHASPSFTLPGGIDIGLPSDSDVVLSLRVLTNIHARADFFTPSEEAARNFAEQSNTFLSLFRSIQASSAPGAADADIKAVFDSIKITQKGDSAEVTATIPPGFLKKLAREPATVQEGGAHLQPQPPAPQPPPSAPKGKKKH
jgi:hypothetical protein